MVDRLIDVRYREDLCRMPTQCWVGAVDAGPGVAIFAGVKGAVRVAAPELGNAGAQQIRRYVVHDVVRHTRDSREARW
jgi:hypothetical protein